MILFALLAVWAFWDYQSVNSSTGVVTSFPQNLTEIGRMGPSMAFSGLFFWAAWYAIANVVALAQGNNEYLQPVFADDWSCCKKGQCCKDDKKGNDD